VLEKKQKKSFDLLVLKAKYLKAQLLMDKESFGEAQKEFGEAYNEVCKTVPQHEQDVLLGNFEKKDKEDPEKNNSDQKEEDLHTPSSKKTENPATKKIYRAIATKSHPDKLLGISEDEAAIKAALFRDAQSAMEEDNLVELMSIAEDLNIPPPEPDLAQLEILEANIKEIQKERKMMKKTTAWEWYNKEDAGEKEDILIRYMQYIYVTYK
jgi:hypothetical protein